MIAVHLPEPQDVLIDNEIFKILYPHEVLASLYENYRDIFNAMFDVREAARFWDDVKETKLFREHPLSGRSDKARAFPIGLHGDGAPVSAKGKTWQKSADFLSFSSLIGTGPHRLLHIIISAVWPLGSFRGVYFFVGGWGGAGRTNKCTLGCLQVAVPGRKLGGKTSGDATILEACSLEPSCLLVGDLAYRRSGRDAFDEQDCRETSRWWFLLCPMGAASRFGVSAPLLGAASLDEQPTMQPLWMQKRGHIQL